MVRQAVVQQVPEGFAGSRPVAAPPEPRSAVLIVSRIIAGGFVQGAEEDRDSFVLKGLERNGDLVDVPQNALVLPGPLLQGLTDVEIGLSVGS